MTDSSMEDRTQILQAAKAVVRALYGDLDAATRDPGTIADALARHMAPDARWRGMHPFDTREGPRDVADAFWAPLARALGPIQRRPDIFIAGENRGDTPDADGIWVVEMGHLAGNFLRDWLTIPATGRMAMLRYVEFHRVEGSKVAETASYCDMLAFIRQAGAWPLPEQTGAALNAPGPRTHDGLLHEASDPAEGEATHALIAAMVEDLVGDGVASSREHLEQFWVPDMCWFGPAGIGASHRIDGYMRGHTRPFEAGLEFVRYEGHPASLAEGAYGGFFGYPSIVMRATGSFMGLPASDREGEMRIVDMYRREGDRLAENWIFIDMLHFLACQGLDVLERLGEMRRGVSSGDAA